MIGILFAFPPLGIILVLAVIYSLVFGESKPQKRISYETIDSKIVAIKPKTYWLCAIRKGRTQNINIYVETPVEQQFDTTHSYGKQMVAEYMAKRTIYPPHDFEQISIMHSAPQEGLGNLIFRWKD